jgi:hypothetical protein
MRQTYKGAEVRIASNGKSTLKQKTTYYREDGMDVENTHRELQRLRLDNIMHAE